MHVPHIITSTLQLVHALLAIILATIVLLLIVKLLVRSVKLVLKDNFLEMLVYVPRDILMMVSNLHVKLVLP